MSNKEYVIYQIFCKPTGKSYVGLTCEVKKRKRAHFGHLRRGDHHSSLLQHAYDTYGKQGFVFHVIERNIENKELALDAEMYWIEHLNSFRGGYNMTEGGEAPRQEGKECEWNGTIYPSIRGAARDLGISAQALRRRLELGHTSDEDLYKGYTPCVWNGTEYESMRAAALDNDVPPATMRQRIMGGKVSDDFVSNHIRQVCVWNGVEYPSMVDASNATGLAHSTLRFYLSKGYTCDKDAKNGRVSNSKTTQWNGVKYNSMSEASRATGIPLTTLRRYLAKGYTSDNDQPAMA